MAKLSKSTWLVAACLWAMPAGAAFFRDCGASALVDRSERETSSGSVRVAPVPMRPFYYRYNGLVDQPTGAPALQSTLRVKPDWRSVEWDSYVESRHPKRIRGFVSEDRVVLDEGVSFPIPRLIFRESQLLIDAAWLNGRAMEFGQLLRARARQIGGEVAGWILVRDDGSLQSSPPIVDLAVGILTSAVALERFDALVDATERGSADGAVQEAILMRAADDDAPILAHEVARTRVLCGKRPLLQRIPVRLVALPANAPHTVLYRTIHGGEDAARLPGPTDLE